ncbi:hypothetical protein D8M33_01190 [Micrococcus sp. HSID17245]|nr:hypothetical protein D8M33_01190 [Micrococcus sp. HSID17245]
MSTSMQIDILFIRPGGTGWGPVTELVQLVRRIFAARVIEVDDRGDVSALRKVATALPRGRRRPGHHLLVVAANPAAVAHLSHPRLWLPGYESVAAWIIDSFWTDRTPRILRSRPHVDQLFITDPGLVDEWRTISGLPVACLPWGTDTARFPLAEGEKPVDLLRLGRQPAAWDDDAATAAAAAGHGLVFAGRPAMSEDHLKNQANVRAALLHAKLVLAFSNLVSPAPYTHPTRDYLTGRWMDALAAGCRVVGVAPRAAPRQLWDGATLEISPTNPDVAWETLARAVGEWTLDASLRTQRMARRHLDWRLRLRGLCATMGWPLPPVLAAELDALDASAAA